MWAASQASSYRGGSKKATLALFALFSTSASSFVRWIHLASRHRIAGEGPHVASGCVEKVLHVRRGVDSQSSLNTGLLPTARSI
jgi:hypothetical protein